MITCFYHRLVQALRWHWEQWAHEKDSPIKSKGMLECAIVLLLAQILNDYYDYYEQRLYIT